MAMTKEEQQAAWNKRKKRKALIASVEESGLTKEKYEQLKSENLSDGKIIEKFPGLYPTKLYNWKKAVGLLDTPAAEEEKPTAKLDDDTKSKLSGLKDKLNAPKTSQEPQDEPVECKMTTSLPKEHKPVTVDYEKFCETKDKEIAKLKEVGDRLLKENGELVAKNAELAAEIARLQTDADHLELAQSEIRNLTEQVRELQRCKADYTALEQLHRETRSRLHAAEEENAALTGMETEHIQLMRRHVQLYDRMQGVYGG